MFRRRSDIPSNIHRIERFVWGLYSAPITASSFRFWGSATSGQLGRVTVLPQLKVDRLCSIVDGTAEFDPKATLRGRARSELAAVLGAVTADALTLEGPIGSFL